MKKVLFSLMGIVTVLILTLGVHTSTEYKQSITKDSVQLNAHGNTGG